ncbi:MAG: hypothetical protein GX361_05500 [Bacteroidales bacterium]|nr:hypothetical protein [Bacteroidales bacterium]
MTVSKGNKTKSFILRIKTKGAVKKWTEGLISKHIEQNLHLHNQDLSNSKKEEKMDSIIHLPEL